MITSPFLFAFGLACVLPDPPQPGTVAKNDKMYSCGCLSLFAFAASAGHQVELRRVGDALPPPTKDGHSLEDLVLASTKLGFALSVYRAASRDVRFDIPVITYLKEKKHGHFMVLRPLPDKPHMVQMIDLTSTNEIVEISTLIGRSDWTGYVLAQTNPQPPSFLSHVVAFASTIPLCGCVVFGINMYVKWRRSTPLSLKLRSL